jgi:tetratricopeptide (TPR) repeat protein
MIIEPPIKMPPQPVLTFHPVADNTGKAGILQHDNPVLAHISEYRPYDRTRILRKEKGALYVHFPVAKSDLTRDFRNNADVLDRIIDITRQVMADTTSSVRRIQIVGLASIEGTVDVNERLATNRGEALKRYIQQQVPQATDDLFDVANGGEAWAELRDQMNDVVTEMTTSGVEADGARLAGLREAINIIDTEADLTRREQRLRQLNGGRTFDYIKEHLLADQRNSGYIRIYYDYVPDAAAATINQASEYLQQERYNEALQLLQGVKNDPRAQNALGVALWHTGNQGEAFECFRRAAEQGDDDARENFRQLVKQIER